MGSNINYELQRYFIFNYDSTQDKYNIILSRFAFPAFALCDIINNIDLWFRGDADFGRDYDELRIVCEDSKEYILRNTKKGYLNKQTDYFESSKKAGIEALFNAAKADGVLPGRFIVEFYKYKGNWGGL